MKKLVVLFTLCLAALSILAQTADDKVVISHKSDDFIFINNGTRLNDGTIRYGGNISVRHIEKIDYALNSAIPQWVQPSTYYENNVSLDRAKCGKYRAQYKSIDPDNVFFDSTRVCYFSAELTQKRPALSVEFERTFTDFRYFTCIFLNERYFVRQKTISFTIPKDLNNVRLIPRLFSADVKIDTTVTLTDSVFTFTLKNIPTFAEKNVNLMPPLSKLCPHILVLGSFADYRDLYRWSHALSEQVDTVVPQLSALLHEIEAGSQTDNTTDIKSNLERLSNTYQWVQRNIRYVAYEAGRAAHQPDSPAEVVRKRYGDCKGMALLLRTLLRAQGFDARLAVVGTDVVPYCVSEIPSLFSLNHMLCAVYYQDRWYWLDGTMDYLSIDEVPQHIQGREAIVENGDDCLLLTPPKLPAAMSADSLSYRFELTSDCMLRGRAVYSLSGDAKEHFMLAYDHQRGDNKQLMLDTNLNDDNHSALVSDVAWLKQDSRQHWVAFGGKVTRRHAVNQLGDEMYVELNPHNEVGAIRLDTLKRKYDFFLPRLYYVVREVHLVLPDSMTVMHLPEGFSEQLPYGALSCRFERSGGEIVFHQRLQITDRHVELLSAPQWNDALRRWRNACNEQVVLKKKH